MIFEIFAPGFFRKLEDRYGMKTERILVSGIPAIIWGEPSKKVYLHVHGKMSRKEYAEEFARIAEGKGYQTLSFDLPESGERVDGKDGKRLDVWDGTADVKTMADFAFAHWERVNLYACSIGAYFSLNCLAEYRFENALLQSPVVDMRWLARKMMEWFGVSEEQLEREKEISTPIDPLRWDYFCYSLAHPIVSWSIPTVVLYGGRDPLQSREVIQSFCRRFDCECTISEESDHSFMDNSDGPIVRHWLEMSIK